MINGFYNLRDFSNKNRNMANNILELKTYFYQNLFILKNQQIDVETYENFEETELHKVCNNCDLKGNKCNLMSGFSHTSDFNKLVSRKEKYKISPIEKGNEEPIMFLLENPGTDWEGKTNFFNKTLVSRRLNYWFGEINDYVKNYELKNLDEFSESKNDAYAHSFIHIMRKYKLSNVLVTNTIKCKPSNGARLPVERNIECMELFLKKEIEYFQPKKIFCFGPTYTMPNLNILKQRHPSLFNDVKIYVLYHPSSRFSRKKVRDNWYSKFDDAFPQTTA